MRLRPKTHRPSGARYPNRLGDAWRDRDRVELKRKWPSTLDATASAFPCSGAPIGLAEVWTHRGGRCRGGQPERSELVFAAGHLRGTRVTDPHPIVTDRLILVPFTAEAIEAMIGGDGDALEVATGAAFPRPVVAPPDMADALPFFRDKLLAHPSNLPWWGRVIVESGSGQALGIAGFSGPSDEAGTVVIGYSVYPTWQRRGVATEAVRALVQWALAQPSVDRVRATIAPYNIASRRVAEGAGMHPIGVTHDDEVGTVEIWQIEMLDEDDAGVNDPEGH